MFFDVLRALPRETTPIDMFSNAIIALQRESKFNKTILEGLKKETKEPTYEDSLSRWPNSLKWAEAISTGLKYKK
jgi:citrate synthase